MLRHFVTAPHSFTTVALSGDTADDIATDESVLCSPPKRRADPRSLTNSSSSDWLTIVGLASWPLLAKMLRLAACKPGDGVVGVRGQVNGGGADGDLSHLRAKRWRRLRRQA
jgi:hypothetical protein